MPREDTRTRRGGTEGTPKPGTAKQEPVERREVGELETYCSRPLVAFGVQLVLWRLGGRLRSAGSLGSEEMVPILAIVAGDFGGGQARGGVMGQVPLEVARDLGPGYMSMATCSWRQMVAFSPRRGGRSYRQRCTAWAAGRQGAGPATTRCNQAG